MIKKAQAVAAVREFNRFYTNIIGVVNRHVYESPYSLSEVRVLYEINHATACTARDIKDTLQIDEGYLSRIIDKFVKQKLVKKVQSPEDGRVYVLRLTAKGAALFNKLNEASEHSVEALIEKLSEHKMSELINMMQGVRHILSNDRNMNAISLNDITIGTTLQPGDIGYVIYLHGVLYKQEYDYGVSFEAYVAEGLSEFYHNYDAKKDRVWIAKHNDRMVGSILLMHRVQAAQLRYFLIHPAYRGIGLGKKLMELYMQFLLQRGYTSSYLWTTSELSAAANLYRKHGFMLTEEKPSTAFGKAVIEQRYDWVKG